MKTTITKNVGGLALRAGLLGVALSVAGPAMAAPRDRDDRDVRREKRDVEEARRDVKREKRDVQRADTPSDRRREQHDVQEARNDLRRERQDLRRERREDRSDDRRSDYSRDQRSGQRPNWNSRPASGSRSIQKWTGTVTRVRSAQSFDVRIGGNTFNVSSNSRLPRALDTGDTVRVDGVRTGNTIRNAGVSILNNR